ncbi:MAG: DUF2267 domain-containing protein, partial [Pseudonocardia sp.]|nr:DUF2267 domain-containing protein [Pseudonocardia sp.]
RHYACRGLRAWLHTVRDRVTVDGAAHFAAQPPMLLRGLFFDGWTPSRVPVKYDAEQLVLTAAQEANVSLADARTAIPAVTAALTERCAPGQLDHLLAQLPGPIRAVLRPGAPTAAQPTARTSGKSAPARLEHVEQLRPGRPASAGDPDRRPGRAPGRRARTSAHQHGGAPCARDPARGGRSRHDREHLVS